MRYYKGRPIGLLVLSVLITLFFIYYYLRPFLWGRTGEVYSDMFELSLWNLIVWFFIILDIILVYAVTVGFYRAKNWARIYTMIIITHSALWSLYFIFIERVWPYERYAWFVFYVIIMMYLLMSEIREYFGVQKVLV